MVCATQAITRAFLPLAALESFKKLIYIDFAVHQRPVLKLIEPT
jgi:hypothetical protein